MYCRECGSKMLKDKDPFNKFDFDIYYDCPNCVTSCILEIRLGRRFLEIWHSENDNYVKDLKLKYI